MQFTQGLLDKLDYNLQLSEFINGIETLAYCNYWAANAAFWERYMGFLQPLYQYIRNDLTLRGTAIYGSSRRSRNRCSLFSLYFRTHVFYLSCNGNPIRAVSIDQQSHVR
jgi:hypothetical protein